MAHLEQTPAKTEHDAELHYYRRYTFCGCGFGLSWALLTLCFMIINIIVFIEPQWIGDTKNSPGVGYVGLFQLCEFIHFGSERICEGEFQDFTTILTDAFKASTFFIGVSCLIIFLCVLLFILFLCVYETYVYVICGSLQIVSTVFMFLGCVIFPHGWDHMYVRRICGDDVSRYHVGQCEMRWAYILAIVGVFDIMILAILAFVLACRHTRRWTDAKTVKRKKNGTAAGQDVPDKGYVVSVAPASVVGTEPPGRYRAASSRLGTRSDYGGSQQPVFLNDPSAGRPAPSYSGTHRARNGSF